MTELDLVPDASQRWVQSLDPWQARQALVGFGLWSPIDGNAPTDDLEMAYRLAERTLGLSRQVITFRAEGTALICHFVYADRPVAASAQPHALALTRAVLRAVYEARMLPGGDRRESGKLKAES